jgi:hypothetical protein
MSQGEDFGPLFEAAQLCRTSGNSAECFNAIDEYAKSYTMGQQVSPRAIQMQADEETRYGYDLNVIDQKLIAGTSYKTNANKNMQVRDPNNPSEFITIELPKIRKEEEPSLHQNRSVHFNQAFPISSSSSASASSSSSSFMTAAGNQMEKMGNGNTITLPPVMMNSAEHTNQQHQQHQEHQRYQQDQKNNIQLPSISSSSSTSSTVKPPPYKNVSDINRETYAFLLFIGIFVPLLFIILVIILENWKQ